MSYVKKRSFSDKSEYSVIYDDMHGVDFSSDGSNISRKRFSYVENMYKDYDSGGAGFIESIPGYRKIFNAKARIIGMYSYITESNKTMLVIHEGTSLYELDTENLNSGEYIVTSGLMEEEYAVYSYDGAMYFMNGHNVFVISEKFRGSLGNSSPEIYIPTTYINNKEYEQRNLLTRFFREKTIISSPDAYAFASEGLKYKIIDEDNKSCQITGIDSSASSLYIPSRIMIADTYYKVKEIGFAAFRNNDTIKKCYIAEGVVTIGAAAFCNCKKLESITLPDSVRYIGDAAFSDCSSLKKLHLGSELERFGLSAVNLCSSLKEVDYAGDETEFQKIENISHLGNTVVNYYATNNSISIKININSPCITVDEVKIGGVDYPYEEITKDNLCTSLKINIDDKTSISGNEIEILAILSSDPKDYTGIHSGFLTGKENIGDVRSVITGCTIAQSFDGKIFLTGNKKYPGVCFYTSSDLSGENHPLYFGELNYFKDGDGNNNNISLLVVADELAVFKEYGNSGESIYYHRPESTDIDILPKIYPVSSVQSGIFARGKTLSFFDDPVFVTDRGICGLQKKTVNLERNISARSTLINPKLLSEKISDIKLAVWRGYLVAAVNGNIYLGDSRDIYIDAGGNIQYEWYFLSGIGAYVNDKRVYRYRGDSPSSVFKPHIDIDGVADGEVLSTVIGGETVYYVVSSEGKHPVYPTEEFKGGTFKPLCCVHAVEDRLFFGTTSGDIFVFNNDMRGIAPPSIANAEGFNEEEYKSEYQNIIHPFYYSFNGHAPRYALKTAKDNGGIPHMLKNTVKNSLVLKCRAISSGKIICEIGTDDKGYREVCNFPGRDLFFGDLNFSFMTMLTNDIYSVAVKIKTKNWVEQQISIYSEEYGSAFGICAIAYRFTVKGNIKQKRQ